MKNTKFIEGAFRFITDENGMQLLATADGVKIPRITNTTTSQNTEQARRGICVVEASFLVNSEGFVRLDDAPELADGKISYNGRNLLFESLTVDFCPGEPVTVHVKCIAYPDTTFPINADAEAT